MEITREDTNSGGDADEKTRLPEDLQQELSERSGRKQFASAVVLSIFFYLALVALLGSNGFSEYTALVQGARNEGVSLASVVSEEVDQSLLLLDQVLAGMDAMLQAAEKDGSANAADKITAYLTQRTRDIDFLMHLLAFGPNRELLHKSTTGAPHSELLSMLEQHWTSPGGGLRVSTPRPMRTDDDTWYFTVSEGVHGPDGSFHRLHAAAVDLKGFYSRFEEVHLQETFRITIASNSGTVMYTIPRDEASIGEEHPSLAFAMKDDARVGSRVGVSELTGAEAVTSWAKVDDAPIVVFVERPLDEVLERWRTNLYVVALLCIAMLVGLIIFLVFQARAQKRIAAFQRRLALQASTDPLTGTLNRRFFMYQARKEAYRARRYEAPLTAIIFDLDHFKRVNDSFGHDAGDEVLRQTAAIARNNLRETDLLCRYGGEEFAILLPATDRAGGDQAAEKIRESLENASISLPEKRIHVTASFGVAEWTGEDTRVGLLLTRADEAMYKAKKKGRNKVCTWSEECRSETQDPEME